MQLLQQQVIISFANYIAQTRMKISMAAQPALSPSGYLESTIWRPSNSFSPCQCRVVDRPGLNHSLLPRPAARDSHGDGAYRMIMMVTCGPQAPSP